MKMFFIGLLLVIARASRLNNYDNTTNLVTESQGYVLDGQVYALVQVIGGSGGETHKIYGGGNGKVVEEIMVWAGESQIKAIKITLTDDDPLTFGVPGGSTDSYKFDPGEIMTKLSLWGNGAGTRLGAIRFDTSKGKHFDIGMTKWGRKQEYQIDVGSGICVGLFLNSGTDIDNAGFVFLNPISSSTITDISYPQLSFNAAGVTPQNLEHFSTTNRQNTPVKWRFGNILLVETKESWSTTNGVEKSLQVRVTSGVPEVAQTRRERGWKVSQEQQYDVDSTTKKSLSWNETGVMAPGDSLSLTATVVKGEITTPYSGVMRITMESGEEFQYPYQGVYQGISYSDVLVVTG